MAARRNALLPEGEPNVEAQTGDEGCSDDASKGHQGRDDGEDHGRGHHHRTVPLQRLRRDGDGREECCDAQDEQDIRDAGAHDVAVGDPWSV